MSVMPDSFVAGKRQFWRQFLKLYEQMPELWNVSHADYRNKELRNESYEILQNKLREIQPNATKSDVGRRINIFRTNYRREQMRIWKQHDLGLHSDMCKPTLWFYDDMSFLLSQESFQHRARRQRGRPSIKGRSCFLGLKNNDDITTIALPTPITTAAAANDNAETLVFSESLLVSPKIEILETDLDALDAERTDVKLDNADTSASELNEPATVSNNSTATTTVVNGSQQLTISESTEALAKSWAIQYEEMMPVQRILARKAIADILFEGCTGNLRINRLNELSFVGNKL